MPNDINLGDPALAAYYAQATWDSPTGVQKGAPILFAVTIPKDAKNISGAEAFIRYIISGPGHAALLKAGLQSMTPVAMGPKASVPATLRSLLGK